ncbi:MAG: hypothetical protein ACR2OU_01260 [Thermomicrobiales bacterium]
MVARTGIWPVATNGQDVSVDNYFNVVGVHARQLGDDFQRLDSLEHFQGWSPATSIRAPDLRSRRHQRVKQLIQF